MVSLLRHCISCAIALVIPDTWTSAMSRAKNFRCRKCYSAHNAQYAARYRAKTKDKARDDLRKWREANPDKYSEQLERARLKKLSRKS